MTIPPEQLAPFVRFIGATFLQRTADGVRAEIVVREELTNREGFMHGGAVMAIADQCGGMATGANLRVGQVTTTIESKTNFLAAIRVGDRVVADCTPLHRGRSTMVWQTRITRGDGKLAALVTQTQMIISSPSGD